MQPPSQSNLLMETPMFLFVLKSRELPDSYYVPVLGTRGKWDLVRSIAEGIQRTQAPSVRTVITAVLQMLEITRQVNPDSVVLKDAVLRFATEVGGLKRIVRFQDTDDSGQKPDGYVLRRKIGDSPEYLFADSEQVSIANTYRVVPDNNVILPPTIKVFPASEQGTEQIGRAIYAEAYRRGYHAARATRLHSGLVPPSGVFEVVPVAVTTPSAFILLEEGAYPEGARLF